MTFREIIKILHSDGWYELKPGKVTVPKHKGDIAPGTLNSIMKQADLK